MRVIKMTKSKYFLGIDDGYAETKIVMDDGRTFRIPSIAKAGEMNQVSINGSETTVFPYQTSDGNYISGSIQESDPTAFDEYPYSPLNRVIVSHAMRQCNIPSNAEIYVCSGLPVKKYYIGGKMNSKLIKAKMKNWLKNDVVPLGGGLLPTFVKHDVISEGIAAYFDLVMVRNSEGRLQVDQDIRSSRVGIIDIGGRTTDIAVIQDGNLDTSRSNTVNVGMLAVKEAVKESVQEKYDLTPTLEQLNQALTLKKIKMYGAWEGVQDIVKSAEQAVASRIESECRRCLSNSSDLDQIVFVGGTVVALEEYIQGWFKQQRIGDDPSFANARGMQKFAEYSMMKR